MLLILSQYSFGSLSVDFALADHAVSLGASSNVDVTILSSTPSIDHGDTVRSVWASFSPELVPRGMSAYSFRFFLLLTVFV